MNTRLFVLNGTTVINPESLQIKTQYQANSRLMLTSKTISDGKQN